jgi:hypothetical protein
MDRTQYRTRHYVSFHAAFCALNIHGSKIYQSATLSLRLTQPKPSSSIKLQIVRNARLIAIIHPQGHFYQCRVWDAVLPVKGMSVEYVR